MARLSKIVSIFPLSHIVSYSKINTFNLTKGKGFKKYLYYCYFPKPLPHAKIQILNKSFTCITYICDIILQYYPIVPTIILYSIATDMV